MIRENTSQEQPQSQPQSQPIFWTWSNGTKMERSSKQHQYQYQQEHNNHYLDTQYNDYNHNQTMNVYMNTDSQQQQQQHIIQDGYQQREKKRDNQNEKLSMRSLTIQKGMNPFINSTQYIQHLEQEEEFLRPRNSDIQL